MELCKNVIILEILCFSSLEFFDVGSCTKSFGDFAEEKNHLNIFWFFVLSHSSRNSWTHLERKSIEVGRTVEVNIANFILNFGIDLVELDFVVERSENSVDLSHIFDYIIR